MTRMIVLLSLVAVQLGAANSPCATAAPPAPANPGAISTTGWCDTPLCKGLVGAGAGVAGLAAIGGVAAALAAPKKTTTKKVFAAAPPPKKPSFNPIITTTGKKNFRLNDDEKGSDWLLPLLLGLLALCCILGLIGYFCMNKKSKPAKKAAKKAAPVATETRDLEVAPSAEVAPLMGGHWEQPMQVVPVTTTAASYTPAVAPAYTMAAQTYAMPTVMETVAPTYAMAPSSYVPAVSGAYPYATAPTAFVESVAPAYGMAQSSYVPAVSGAYPYATAPTAFVESVAPAYGTSGYVV